MAAVKLVCADRSSLFLVDSKSEELYAHVFSVGPDESSCVKRIVEVEVTSVDGYINQLGHTLKEMVSYNGKLVRYASYEIRPHHNNLRLSNTVVIIVPLS